VCTGARGEDDGAMVEKRVAERAHNGSWLGTHVFWEERINKSRDIFILLKHINGGSQLEPLLII
jgi:hypothetical protein